MGRQCYDVMLESIALSSNPDCQQLNFLKSPLSYIKIGITMPGVNVELPRELLAPCLAHCGAPQVSVCSPLQPFSCERSGCSLWWEPSRCLWVRQPLRDAWGPVLNESCLWIKHHLTLLAKASILNPWRIWENPFGRYFVPAGRGLGEDWDGESEMGQGPRERSQGNEG